VCDELKNYDELKAFYQKIWVHQHVPFCIERYDGAKLWLNNDFKSYSFETDSYYHSMWPKYSYRRLFMDPRVKAEDFKVVSWAPIENLFEHPEKYFTERTQITSNYRTLLKDLI